MTGLQSYLLRKIPLVLLICFGLALQSPLYAQLATEGIATAIIPLSNFADQSGAADLMLPQIKNHFEARGFTILDPQLLRDFMRQWRIRLTGEINSVDAARIRNEFGIRLLIIGAIDFFDTLESRELGVSLRIYDCERNEIVWAGSHSTAAQDHVGLLGMGSDRSVQYLIQSLLQETFKKIPGAASLLDSTHHRPSENESQSNQLKVAVIDFENLSSHNYTGDIAANVFYSTLFRRSCQLLEPGEVTSLLASLGEPSRGELSLRTIAQLNEQLDADIIVTGTVHEAASGGGSAESTPIFEISLRMIDAADGKVIGSTFQRRTGRDGETIFGLGRTYALGQLMQSCLDDCWRDLVKKSEKRVALK